MRTNVAAATWMIMYLICVPFVSGQQSFSPGKQPSEMDKAALMRGKVKTNRTIFLDITVDAAPSEVFRPWTTVDGVKKFFAPEAKIDAMVGGRYQIIFFPSKDPVGIERISRSRAKLSPSPATDEHVGRTKLPPAEVASL